MMNALFSEPKKESRLVSRRLSKLESKNSENRNSKVDEGKSNPKSERSSALHDKYQALESLFTIFRIAELRGLHD